MTAAPGIRIVPGTGRAVAGPPSVSTRLLIGENLREKVRAIPFESLPCLFSALIEDAVERGRCHHEAARTAAVARVNERELKWWSAHDSLPGYRLRLTAIGVSRLTLVHSRLQYSQALAKRRLATRTSTTASLAQRLGDGRLDRLAA